MRKFKSGAVRDDDDTKIDYEGFISPIVLERFGEYMKKHQKQADGKLRTSDNWQKLFGNDHYSVCMKSLLRHTIDAWKEHRGYKSRDGMEDALCGVIFNAQAYLYKILKEK